MKAILSERGRLVRTENGRDRSMFAVLSTPGVKADGHDVRGWDHPNSVPLLDCHRDAQDGVGAVIGRCFPRMEENRLVGRLTFAGPEVSTRAELAYQLCANGFVDSVSVGFTPLEAEYAHECGRGPSALNISLARLNEVSVVPVPADEDAKILGRALRAQSRGRDTRADRAVIARALRMREERPIYQRYETLHTGYGLTIEMAALHMHLRPEELRGIIARALQAGTLK